MKILIANPGSSSMKCQLIEMPSEKPLARVKIERVGHGAAPTEWVGRDGVVRTADVPIPDLSAAIRYILEKLTDAENGVLDSFAEVAAVGFKAVYAKDVTGCQYIDEEVIGALEEYNDVVAPLHNPAYIHAIRRFREIMPETPMVALFENSPFDKLPDYATVYPIPWDWTMKYGIRKHMFHGASHRFVRERIAEIMKDQSDELKVITCHLGGSSTIMAFRDDVCIDGTGGFTLQCGVPFSVRASDMDAFLIAYLVKKGEGTVDEVVEKMMTEAGLSGISGMGFDMRDLQEAADQGHARAQLAIDTYVHAIRKYIGAFMVELGGLDVITMAGGTGEAGAHIRKLILQGMEPFGIVLDEERNAACVRKEGEITAEGSPVKVWVIPTDEEIIVAREVHKLVNGEPAAPNWLKDAPLFSFQGA